MKSTAPGTTPARSSFPVNHTRTLSAADHLAARDARLGGVIRRAGPCGLRPDRISRPNDDVLPAGDLGVCTGVRNVCGSGKKAGAARIPAIAQSNGRALYRYGASWYLWRSLDVS